MTKNKVCARTVEAKVVEPGGREPADFALPSGTLMRVMFIGCKCAHDLLHKGEILGKAACECIEKAGLKTVNKCYHDFEGGGVTALVILEESHLAMHTWPEFNNTVLADISVCNYSRDNSARVRALMKHLDEILCPEYSVSEPLDMIPRLSEIRYPGSGVYTEIKNIYAALRSRYQDIIVVQTEAYGRALILDGFFQTTELDEHWYHEPLVHVPLLAHPNPENVLICGGGDGGAAEEVLKHPPVKKCRMVELDIEVVNVSKKYLHSINEGVFDDPRFELVISDAFDFLEKDDTAYDAVILDLTDPIGECEKLFTTHFFSMVSGRLAADGKMSVHASFPVALPGVSRKIVSALEESFTCVIPYAHYVPCYSDLMAFALCSNNFCKVDEVETIAERIGNRGLVDLEIITPHTYHSMFALSPAVKRGLYEANQPGR